MKTASRGSRTAFVAFGLLALALTLVSCHARAGDDSFSKKLRKTDTLIVTGRKGRALKALSSLRKDAGSANQWLSIARRERELESYESACKTLTAAVKALPANDGIAACLADTLIELGRTDEASKLTERLASSGFINLAAYCEITRALAAGSALPAGPSSVSGYPAPEWLTAAYRATGNRVFRNDAAVLYAATGKFAEADKLFSDEIESALPPLEISENSATDTTDADMLPLPKDIMLKAIIAYDSGAWSRALDYFPPTDDPRLTLEMLSVIADSAWKAGDTARSRDVWSEIVSRYGEQTPIPYYDLALTSSDPEDAHTTLLRCVELFPAWYPAVARIVRNAGHSALNVDDPVIKSLLSAGFMSFDMEAALHDGHFSPEEARAILDNALKADSNGTDVRLKIEDLRYGLGEKGDTVRSTAAMWRLLEAYGENPVLYRYATWFFAVTGDLDMAFSVNGSNPGGPDPFFLGLEAACAGKSAEAEEAFSRVASNATDSWAALGNIARLYANAGDYGKAEESANLAAELAPDNRVKSRLLGDTGEYLIALNAPDRARKVLGYALELDPDNYRARTKLRSLESGDE